MLKVVAPSVGDILFGIFFMGEVSMRMLLQQRRFFLRWLNYLDASWREFSIDFSSVLKRFDEKRPETCRNLHVV